MCFGHKTVNLGTNSYMELLWGNCHLQECSVACCCRRRKINLNARLSCHLLLQWSIFLSRPVCSWQLLQCNELLFFIGETRNIQGEGFLPAKQPTIRIGQIRESVCGGGRCLSFNLHSQWIPCISFHCLETNTPHFKHCKTFFVFKMQQRPCSNRKNCTIPSNWLKQDRLQLSSS